MSSDIFKDYPDIVEISQLMEMLNISKYSASKLVTENKIKHLVIGRKYRIPKIYVIEYINSQIEKNQIYDFSVLKFQGESGIIKMLDERVDGLKGGQHSDRITL